MKTNLLFTLAVTISLFTPGALPAQVPDLGTAATFALFTGTGAFNNYGASYVTGNIGSNIVPISGFPTPGTVIGEIHQIDAVTHQVATDLNTAYTTLNSITVFNALGSTLGSGQILTAGIYNVGSAATLTDELTLDAENNPNAVFIIKIGGAFSTSASSKVTLRNLASASHVFWLVGGLLTIGSNSVFKGTVIADGAINILEGAAIEGRAFTMTGAINMYNNVVALPINGNTTDLPLDLAFQSIKVSPNPVKSYAVVSISSTRDIPLIARIYNESGTEVITTVLTNPITSINTSVLQSGVYYYVFSNKTGVVQTGKIISSQ